MKFLGIFTRKPTVSADPTTKQAELTNWWAEREANLATRRANRKWRQSLDRGSV